MSQAFVGDSLAKGDVEEVECVGQIICDEAENLVIDRIVAPTELQMTQISIVVYQKTACRV